MDRIEISPANHPNKSIFGVTFEQLFAERKERRLGQTIIFQNDRAFGLTKNPIQTCGNIAPKPDVAVGKSSQHLAWPVDSLDHSAGGGALCDIAVDSGTRTIGNDEKLRRARGADGCKNFRRPLGSIEND